MCLSASPENAVVPVVIESVDMLDWFSVLHLFHDVLLLFGLLTLTLLRGFGLRLCTGTRLLTKPERDS